MKITKKIIFGNETVPLKRQQNNTSTHQWTLFIRPFDESDLSVYNVIDSVTFHLHESFQNSHRKVTQPPFQIIESGWGEFDAVIEVMFKYNLGSITYKHTIILFNQERKAKNAFTHVAFDQLIFINPSDEAILALNSSPL